jgi:hypothetical protein
MVIFKPLLFISLFVSQLAVAQHVDEGAYNDWYYGPHGVYGNLKVSALSGRKFYRINKADEQTVVIQEVNPSGIVVNSGTVFFVNGLLSKEEEMNRWGEKYEYRRYTMVGKDCFRMTNFLRGKNVFLPCKYALNRYDGELLSEIQYFSFTGKPADDRNGVAYIRYQRYDDSIRFGERKEVAFFDADGRPVPSKGTEYHKVVSVYDDQDNKISDDYFGNQDEPVVLRGTALSGRRYFYDADNRLVKSVYHGLDGRVVPNVNGVASLENVYDGGYLMKETRYDSLGNKTRALASGDGIAIMQYEYDNSGNVVRLSYFDTSGKPMNNHFGVQEIATFYSAANMCVQEAYFDEFGRPCVNRDKIHSTVYGRDGLGRIVQLSNYGVDGKPVKTTVEDVYMVKSKYDEYGRKVSDSYWSDSVTRMPHWDGSYGSVTKYNEDGLVVEYASLDANGAPFRTADGSSVMRLVYDSSGLLAERRFLHKNVLVQRVDGLTTNYSIVKYAHDQDARVSELSFWGADGLPADAGIFAGDSTVAHRINFIYRGSRVVETRYFKIGEMEPSRVIDCLKNECVSVSGISITKGNVQ